jgi:flavin-dependent dehydrogenase
VLVVGAGPAGGELARRLAQHGAGVLLVDRLPDLRRSAFSSAAVPLDTVARFGLPAAVVASRWRGWRLIGPGDRRRDWQSPSPLGAVLDFGSLRHWLAEECHRWGGAVQLGRTALDCRPEGERMVTRLRLAGGGEEVVRSDWVIDATGERRALLGEGEEAPGTGGLDPLLTGVGVEWLLEVPEATWHRWHDRLSFCLGSDWLPQGYGWVFPMQPGVLKIGICRYCDPRQPQPPLAPLLERLLERLLEPKERAQFRVLDRHGGRVRSRIHRREPHRRGRLVGLGDVVSTANLLGGEGIRHALTSSAVLTPLLLEALRTPCGEGSPSGEGSREDPLRRYPRRLRRSLGWRWALSGRIARRTWLGLRDARGDRRLLRVLESLESCRAEDLSALLFDYRFERYGLRALPYFLGLR